MPYFFATELPDREVLIGGDDARHLSGPLRARVGELIQVVDPGGRLLGVRLTSVTPAEVRGQVQWERPHFPEPRAQVTLVVAMLPASSLEHILSRCTELGAAGFRLVQAERSVGRADKPARWATICREAAMLAGRLLVPEVAGPMSLGEALRDGEAGWLLDRSAGERLADVAQTAAAAGSPDASSVCTVNLAIGPEGGWSSSEVRLAGSRVASLGPRNLRADTAALTACATWLAASGDL